jgi:glucose-6-phosphate 1-epimerase
MQQTAISQQTGFAHLTDLPCIKLQYGAASAVISLYGGQVLSYQAVPGKELLWLSPKATWHNQAAIRGGVPVCWPWFGKAGVEYNPENIALANHGVVRNQLWQLSHQHSSVAGVSVTLQINIDRLPHQQAGAMLQLCLTLNDSLTISLSCNTVMPQQAALHSYFAITDIDSVLIRPLPGQYYDKLKEAQVADSRCSTNISAETDRIYHQSARQMRLDSAEQALSIHQAGHDATVVWNPWQEKSSNFSDLENTSYRQFVCVETARLNSSSRALTVSQQLKII